MAEAVQTLISYAKQDSTGFGEVPGGVGDYKVCHYRGDGLQITKSSISADEIDSARNVTGVRRVNQEAGGSLQTRLMSGTQTNDFLQYGLQAATAFPAEAVIIAATDVDVVADGGGWKFTTAGVFGNLPTAALPFFRVSGMNNAGNNGLFKLQVGTTATSTEIRVENDGGMSAETDPNTATIDRLGALANGATLGLLYFQKEFQDLTTEWHRFPDCAISGFSLAAELDQLTAFDINLIGTDLQPAAAILGSAAVAADADDLYGPIDDITGVFVGGTPITLQSFNLTLDNNMRSRRALANLGAVEAPGSGRAVFTGSISGIFSDALADVFALMAADTTTSMLIGLKDTSGDSFVFDLPSIRFTDGDALAAAVDTDVVCNLPFAAFKDATEGITCRVGVYEA